MTDKEVSHALTTSGRPHHSYARARRLEGQTWGRHLNRVSDPSILYDRWLDQVLAYAATAFEVHQQTWSEACLVQENAKRKELAGELLLERKNSDEGQG